MKTIQIKLSVDPSNTMAVEALQNLFAAIGGAGTKVVNIKSEDVAVKIKAVKETPKQPDQLKEVVISENQTDTLAQDAADKVKDEAPVSAVKLQDVRDELGKKINEHRDAIKNKLTELGAKNVSSLEAIHFEAVYEFLKAL